jgi:DNA repair protein RadC
MGRRMQHRSLDLLALGAAVLPTHDLVRILTRDRLPGDEVHDLARALGLSGPARDAALRGSRAGPELLAALELGRRALLWPSPAGRRVRGPADVAAILHARCRDQGEELWVIALDARLTLARIAVVSHGDEDRVEAPPAAVLAPVLAAGCRRFVIAHRHAGTACASSADERTTLALAAAAACVDVALLDHVILGEDGHTSLLRSGLLAARDRRYA